MRDYFIYYTESNLVCLVIFAMMLAHDLLGVDRQEKQIKFDKALIAFMLYFVSDTLWAAVIAGVLPKTLFSVLSANFANYVFMAALTYYWLEYVMAVEQAPHRNRRINKFAVVFPFLVSTVVLFAVYLFAPRVLLSDDLQLMPAANVFLIAVPIINIAAVIIYTMGKAHNEENPIEKKRHIYIGLFPLIVILGGLFQMVFLPNTPVFCFCCTILMLMNYIQSMETQISMDPLTKLSNRGQLMRYVSQKSNIQIEGRRTFVLMMDVNDFKSINDTYGHAEGDKALQMIADTLREVVWNKNLPSFLGRYGGDEFILLIHPATETELEPIIGEIRRQIEEKCRADGLPYILSVGIGYDELLNEADTFQKCLQRADHKLYLDKEYCKLGEKRKETVR